MLAQFRIIISRVCALRVLPPFGNDRKIPDSAFAILWNAISYIDIIQYLVALIGIYSSMNTVICFFRGFRRDRT